MRLELAKSVAAAAVVVALTAACCRAGKITDWRTYRGSAATTLAGQGTEDPVIGNLSGSTANMAFLVGYFDETAVLGPNAGDHVTMKFGVRFNDAAGMLNGGDNFRFALFDLNGEAQDSATGGVSGGPNYATAGTANTDNWRGYWFGTKNGSGTGSGGSIRERDIALTTATDNPFSNTTGDPAASLGPVGGDPVTLVSDVNGNGAGAFYQGVMTLTRNALGGIDLSGSFKGSNSTNENLFSATDTSANGSNYGAVAFLFGNGINADQAIFRNVSIAIPEPASSGLALVLLIGGACLRRRHS